MDCASAGLLAFSPKLDYKEVRLPIPDTGRDPCSPMIHFS
jgi:hypothetical protein